MAKSEPRKPGRPRDETARRNILTAARELLSKGGLSAVTVEAIASRAGVGKPTVYRHWPNAQAVAMDAFVETARPVRAADDAVAVEALRGQLRGVAAAFASPAGRSTAAMIAAAQNDSELARVFRNRFIAKMREDGRALLERAAAQGEIRADADFGVALDLIYAPLYFRLLIGHGPLDAGYTDALLDLALAGLRPTPP